MELFTIMAKLMLDNSEYNSGIAQADSSGRALADKLTGYFEKVKKFITLLGIGAAIKSAASAIWNLANQTASAGDAIDKNSQALGMSRKGYQEWAYILGQSGSSIESMGAVMRNLNNVISQNSAETSAALARLGLSAAHLQSLSPEQQFEALVRAFQNLPPSAEKSQLAVKLFGRGAQELMPLLNSSADTVDTLKQRAHDLGLVMSDEDVDAAVAFGDALDDLKKSWDALKMKLGAQLLPGFTKAFLALADAVGSLSNKMTEALKTGDWSGFFGELTKQIGNLIPTFVDNLIGIITGIFSNATKLVSLATAIVNGLIIGITEALPLLIEQLPSMIDTIWSGLRDSVENLANVIIGLINEVFGTNIPEIDLSGVQSAFQWFVDNQDTIVTAVGAIIGAFVASKIISFVSHLGTMQGKFELVSAAIAVVAANWDTIEPWLNQVWDVTINWLSQAWDDVSSAFTEASNWVGKTWDTGVKWVLDAFEAVDNAFDKAEEWVNKTWNTTVNWVNQAWDDVSNAFTEVGKWANKAFDTTVNWINSAWEAVSNAFTTATEWVNKSWETTVSWARKGWADILSAFGYLGNQIANAWEATVSWARKGWTETKSAFISLGDWIGEKWDATVNFIQKGWESISTSFENLGALVAKAYSVYVSWFTKGWANIRSIFGQLGKWLSESWDITITFLEKGWNTIKGYVDKISEWVKNGFNIAVNFVQGLFGGGNQGDQLISSGGGGAPDIYAVGGSGGGGGRGHAKGLNYVPYDNYPALLHRGETILNQAQGREWRQNRESAFNSQELYSSVAAAVAAAVGNIQVNMDSKAVGNAVTGQVSRNIYQAQLGRRFAG